MHKKNRIVFSRAAIVVCHVRAYGNKRAYNIQENDDFQRTKEFIYRSRPALLGIELRLSY